MLAWSEGGNSVTSNPLPATREHHGGRIGVGKTIVSTRPVPALVRAKRILDACSVGGRPKGVSDIAQSLQLPKSTVHGLCRTLVDLGLMMRIGQSQYAVGPHVLAWANAFENQSDLTQEFLRICEGTDFVPKETINLTILVGGEVMYVASRRGTHPLGVGFRVGMRLPAPFTATGKAIMSTMAPRAVDRIFASEWPQPWTQHSVRSLTEMHRELEEVRRRGYSVDNGQLRESMVCFGAPVFGPEEGPAIAGIAIGLLSDGVDKGMESTVIGAVRELAAQLSRRLGGRVRIRIP
jgi:DNA-binding IclR family transcriptional regulator